MPDSKITALTALTAADPANDMIPIVDVSDTPPASGNTKRISINNILACSPTATLASATISGDLTVDTSVFKVNTATDQVGIGTATPTSSTRLDVVGGAFARFNKGAANQYHLRIGNSAKDYGLYVDIDNNGTNGFALYDITAGVDMFRYVPGASGSWTYYINNTTAMILNSTGLGVGEAASLSRFQARATTNDSSAYVFYGKNSSGNAIMFMRNDGRFIVGSGIVDNLIVTETGNVGIGVAPSYKLHVFGASPILGIQDSSSAAGGVGGTINFLAYTSGTSGANIEAQIKGVKSSASSAGELLFFTSDSSGNSQQRFMVDGTGSLVLGAAAVATTATDGFLYIPGCAGTPTGTPTAKTGRVPLVVDTTNNKLYFYSGGAWVAAN